jgi:hypothetical protein
MAGYLQDQLAKLKAAKEAVCPRPSSPVAIDRG